MTRSLPGTSVHIPCTSFCSPDGDVVWMFRANNSSARYNAVNIRDDPNLVLTADDGLVILNVTGVHAGTYQCTYNDVVLAEHSITLSGIHHHHHHLSFRYSSSSSSPPIFQEFIIIIITYLSGIHHHHHHHHLSFRYSSSSSSSPIFQVFIIIIITTYLSGIHHHHHHHISFGYSSSSSSPPIFQVFIIITTFLDLYCAK